MGVRDQRPAHRLPGELMGPIPAMRDILGCPTRRMDVNHYRPDGTCICVPPRDESLEPHIVRGEN